MSEDMKWVILVAIIIYIFCLFAGCMHNNAKDWELQKLCLEKGGGWQFVASIGKVCQAK